MSAALGPEVPPETTPEVAPDLAVHDVDVDDLIATRVTAGHALDLPPAVARVNEAVATGATIAQITKLVQLDESLSENVARLARSAAYTGAVGERISLPYAVMRLGTEGVRAVCLTTSLAKVAMRPGPLLPLRRNVWRECLASALACEAIGGRHGASSNDAYLIGLLHDYGKVVALTVVEDELRDDLAAGHEDPFWADVAERHHCDVGWIVTDSWCLPASASIPSITATHHFAPARIDLSTRTLHDLVTTSDRVVGAAVRRGWQISADDIERIDGVASRDEAMALRIAIAKHPYYLTAVT